MMWFEGKIIMQNGQRYTCVGSKPHKGRDGGTVTLVRWKSLCATCSKPFEAAYVDGAAPSLSRRCAKHKKPGVPVKRVRK